MKKYDQEFQRKLKQRKDELLSSTPQLGDIEVTRSPDEMEEIQQRSAHTVAIRGLELLSNQLREVEAALERLKNGGFGMCQGCRKKITKRRLTAVPWAAFCINCQKKRESKKTQAA